jgi:large subunit ribosomal protein L24
MKKIKIKKGDIVEVLSGNYKKKRGEVLFIFPKKYKAIIKGINMIFKHVKPSVKNSKGKINKVESAIHISNLMLIDSNTLKPVKIGRIRDKNGNIKRYSKKTNKIL